MNVLSFFEQQTLPFLFSVEWNGVERNGTKQNGKNALILAPRTVVEMVRMVQLVQCEPSITCICNRNYYISLPIQFS